MNWLDLAIVVVAAIGLIKGLFDGLIKQIISLVSFILAIFFAGKTARPLRDFLISRDSITHFISLQVISVICYILAFILIIIIFGWIGKLLNKAIASPMSCINYILGGLLGCSLSLLALSLLFNVLIVFDSNSKILKEQTKNESIFFYKVGKIVPLISPFIKEAIKIQENLPLPVKDNPQENKEPDKNNDLPGVIV